MAILLLLLGAITFALSTGKVQNWIIYKTTAYLSKELQTKVSISGIKINLFDKIDFYDLYIADRHNDTMFYFKRLGVELNHYNTSKRYVLLNRLLLVGTKVHFKQYPGEADLNYQFIIDYFDNSSNSGGGSWVIKAKKTDLQHCEFLFWDQEVKDPSDRRFHENHFVFTDINARLKNFTIIDDSIRFQCLGMQFHEKSGLALQDLKADVTICGTHMTFDSLNLKTPLSTLGDKLVFTYDSYRVLDDFVDSVTIDCHLKNSLLSFTDLAYFSDNLKPFNYTLAVSGDMNGTIRNFKAKNLELNYGNTKLSGKAKLRGLPNTEATFVDADIVELKTSAPDLERLTGMEMPQEVYRMGNMRFSGQFLGFFKDFVAFGFLDTEAGSLESDLNMKIAAGKPEVYSGKLKATAFDLGKIYETESLGITSFDLTLNGSGLKPENFKALIKGNISEVVANNYHYRDIEVNGNIDKKFFKGNASIKDQNIDMVFKGDVDFNTSLPRFDFTSNIKHANLKALGFDTTNSKVNGVVTANFTGNRLDNFTGTANIDNLNIERGKNRFHLDNTFLLSTYDGNNRNLVFNSDIADVNINGKFNYSNLRRVYSEFVAMLFPDYYPEISGMHIPVDITLNTQVKKPEIITTLLSSKIKLSQGIARGHYNSMQESLKFWSNFDFVGYDDITIEQWDLNINKKPGELLNMSTEAFGIKQDRFIRSNYLLFTASIMPNFIDFTLNMDDTSHQAKFFTFGHCLFSRDSLTMQFEDGFLKVFDQKWNIDNSNRLTVFNGNTTLSDFSLLSGAERLNLNGFVYADNSTEMGLSLHDFNLKILSPLLASDYIKEMQGIANGTLDISGKWYEPGINSDLIIENLTLNKDTLGNFKLISKARGENPLEMDIYSTMQKGLLKDLEIIGKIDLADAKENFDLKLTWKNGEIKPLQQFFEGVASDFSGTLSSVAYVSGTFDKPVFNGTAVLDSCSFMVDYTNVRYSLRGNLMLSDKKFGFNYMEIADAAGNRGMVSGGIAHNLFDDFNLDVRVSGLQNFMALNTRKGDNELFYGSAIIDGSCLFRGPLNDIYMNLNAKSRKGTNIYIPLFWETDNTTSGYIQFAKFEETAEVLKKRKYEVDGFAMDFNFEITNDAYIEMIFDELMDDRIKGRGNGNLKMEINTFGDFSMYGNYVIEVGQYHFTALNFISKEFNIVNGSRINWDGNPYDGKMKIEATKREYAQPADLLTGLVPNEELQYYRTKIPVDCQLFLNGLLFSPEISFGLSFPNQNSVSTTGFNAFNSVVSRIQSDPEELNRQVFSLLVLGSFIPPGYSGGTASFAPTTGLQNTVNNSVGDLISNQLSNWISQIDPKWQVGIDWQRASEATKKELIFSVKRKFLNDRLEFDGSVDANAINGRNPYNLNIQYNITADGRFKVRGFSKFANDPTLGIVSNISTTGVGFFYRRQFDHFRLRKKTDAASAQPTPAIKPENDTTPKPSN